MSADLAATLDRLDGEHAQDPRTECDADGTVWPSEQLYARRMLAWLRELYPGASPALTLAVAAQHMRRWEIPRESYPEGRDGYIRWRTHLKRHQARVTGGILDRCAWDGETVTRVTKLVRKQGIKTDPEVQALEDVAAVVFLAHEADAFVAKHPPEKVVRIFQKTWAKMSETGRAAARALPLSAEVTDRLDRALTETQQPDG